ncbi:hypothetical protein RJ490_004611 [Pluralibacter gergoviae]|nr:hypothetical protein [Pluralibacter gergoviae]ELD4273685.1 hypothetical protein [Pluralibacter gergoviae]ELD4279297.1 hypothetical protein [Pluralibacter gergoviae]ELD4318768.1 hypothetical protein [Pluralibacter gergoviae]ELD4343847.1 hypothetical protein [Pluralibacter gergoviae]
MKPNPIPLIYPFENPSLTAGLAAINATSPLFITEVNHLETWFKEGVIARYMLVDDIRELWNREGMGAFFNVIFGEAKGCRLIASRRAGMEWSRLKGGEIPTYDVYGIDTAEALYTEDCEENSPPARTTNNNNNNAIPSDLTDFELPMPEPVLPRYEALKIYAMTHGLSTLDSATREKNTTVTTKQSKALVSALKVIGFTDEDFTGEIPALQTKLTRKGLGDIAGHDKNTWVDWLKKAGKR